MKKSMDTIIALQTIFIGITAVATICAASFAFSIGKKQNEINERALQLNDFAEVFLMPQQITYKKVDSEETQIGWKLLIKNASSYPIYLHKYTINGEEKDVGGSAIPASSDSWYTVPLSEDLEKFEISIKYADHRGRTYLTNGKGEFVNNWWSIHSTKRTELN